MSTPVRPRDEVHWPPPIEPPDLSSREAVTPVNDTAAPARVSGSIADLVRTSDITATAPRSDEPSSLGELARATGDVVVAQELLAQGVTPERAAELATALLHTSTSLASFGPKLVLIAVLGEIACRGHRASGAELAAAWARHASDVVVRPDGVLARATTGEPLETIGRPRIEDGVGRAGSLEIGRLYVEHGGLLRESSDGSIVYERGLQTPWETRPLDGMDRALVGLGRSLVGLLTHPLESLEQLAELPANVVAVVLSAPDVVDHLANLPRGEQVAALTELAFSMYLARGAQLATRGLAGGVSASVDASASLGAVSGGSAALRFAEAISVEGFLAEARALGIAGGGAAVGVAPIAATSTYLANRLGSGAHDARLSAIAEASTKRAGRLLSPEAAARLTKGLPLMAAERERMLVSLRALMDDSRLSPVGRSAARDAHNAVRDHLSSEDLVGALRDRLGIPVRRPGSGEAYNHLNEVENTLQSLVSLQDALRAQLQHLLKVAPGSPLHRELSAIEERLGKFAAQARAVLESR